MNLETFERIVSSASGDLDIEVFVITDDVTVVDASAGILSSSLLIPEEEDSELFLKEACSKYFLSKLDHNQEQRTVIHKQLQTA